MIKSELLLKILNVCCYTKPKVYFTLHISFVEVGIIRCNYDNNCYIEYILQDMIIPEPFEMSLNYETCIRIMEICKNNCIIEFNHDWIVFHMEDSKIELYNYQAAGDYIYPPDIDKTFIKVKKDSFINLIKLFKDVPVTLKVNNSNLIMESDNLKTTLNIKKTDYTSSPIIVFYNIISFLENIESNYIHLQIHPNKPFMIQYEHDEYIVNFYCVHLKADSEIPTFSPSSV